MTAQLIQLAERRRTAVPARETQDQVDELRAELAVRQAESLIFTRRIHALGRRALYANVKERPDEVESLLTGVIRLSLQEEARAIAAVAPDPDPIPLPIAA